MAWRALESCGLALGGRKCTLPRKRTASRRRLILLVKLLSCNSAVPDRSSNSTRGVNNLRISMSVHPNPPYPT